MATIIRQAYIDKIEKYLGKETIIVLVGQRRVGKSYMMKTVRDQKASNPDNNIIYIDKEKREFDSIRNYQDLNQYMAVCLAWQKSDWKKTMPVNIRWTYSTQYC